MTLFDKYKVSEENKRAEMKSPIGQTHEGSKTQAKIHTFGSMSYTILTLSSIISKRNMRKTKMKLRLVRLTPYQFNTSMSVCPVISTLPR